MRSTKRAIHQVITSLNYGDAIANHTIELMKLLRSWGYPSEVYVEMCDPRMALYCRPFATYRDDPDDILIYEYGLGSELTDFLLQRGRMGRTYLYYHNITPPHFFEPIESEFAALLRRGREDLYQLYKVCKGAVAVTEYNQRELRDIGFASVSVVPYLLDLSSLERSANSPAGQRIRRRFKDECVNIVFVGRLAPNKKQEDLLQALAYYKKLIDSRVRLLLVGSGRNFRYRVRLEMLAEQLGVLEDVHFSGQLALEEGFAGYYKAGSVFLCLSEHEGFGVPLVESMFFDLPIIAYKSSAVPETLGGSGLLVTEKRYDVIGELIYNIATDETLRQQVICKQRERLIDFDRPVVESQIKTWVETLEDGI
jgi:glycosyltransferase involved in cell wall biosynthesis